jgi:hypothetical protein
MKNYLLLFLFCFSIFSQAQNFESTIQNYLNSNAEQFDFQSSDIQEFSIINQSFSKSMNLHNVYVQQTFQGVPLKNAIGSFAIKQNRVLSFKHSFISNIGEKISTSNAILSAENAIIRVANTLDLFQNPSLQLKETISDSEFIFESDDLSVEEIPIKKMFVYTDADKLRIAWDLSILTKDEKHWWSISIDAQTGEILEQNDWILTCNFDHNHAESHKYNVKSNNTSSKTLSVTLDGSQYRAYPLGVESPNHGDRELLNQPADPVASPFGWHDTDGLAGPEFTITRGNNVWASEDRNDDNFPGFSPDGGSELIFDFPYNLNLSPIENQEAAITNLFVWNNYNHDFWYAYGFDETSGNFQQTNYTGEGLGNDYVRADAQDGSGLNNANFGTPPDGNNPRMQMFLWSPPPGELLTVNSPSDIEGGYIAVEAGFGPNVPTNEPLTSDLVLVEDDNSTTSDPHDACDPITNGADLEGKIVVINRGNCTFVSKIQAAQDNGAIAVIMINNVPGNPITMGGDSFSINIPSVMISLDDGSLLIPKLQNGETINASIFDDGNGPSQLDSSFDNGIIVHEYGHGISNRLTGGAQQVNCLFNEEQMGEGWSDWLGLMMTMQPGDFAEQPRGIGTFAVSQPTEGQGIRPAPYSTDLTVNPATYGLTNNPGISRPHGVGYVWASMLWDLTWELIDQYGYDPDLINGNGGNNLAIQLVLDGMKLQNCLPGFIDGRDAILQADMLANDGANQCYIWKVFANRGLGISASQGSSFNRFDQEEAFDLPPEIILPCAELSTQSFNSNSLKIYPNPADNIVNVESLAGTVGNANLKIYDLNGRLLSNQPINFNEPQQIDVSKFQRGVYVLKIENTSVNISKKLIIK